MEGYLEKIKYLLNNICITGRTSEIYNYTDGVKKVIGILKGCKMGQQCLYICGNGGSAGIAQHMTADFFKNAGIRTYDMYGQATMTCISNDLAYEYVFSKQLELMAGRKDILVAVSSSGESENIVRAAEAMRQIGGTVLTFTGFLPDNRLRGMGDINIYIPVEHYGMVESIHNLILQQMVDIIVDMDGSAMA